MEIGKKLQKRSDVVVTVAWLLMDGCWMNDVHIRVISILVLTGMFSLIIGWFGIIAQESSRTVDHVSHFAVGSWFLMNVHWMAADIALSPPGLPFSTASSANIMFGAACLFTMLSITLSSETTLDRLKRFKIK
jgi:hypothetical protein